MRRTEAYVVFQNSDNWTNFLFKKGFGHCLLLINDGFNWVRVNASLQRLEIDILNYTANEDITKYFKCKYPDAKIFKTVVRKKENKYRFRVIRNLSCVSIVTYYLGLPFYILTPRQLYKYLCKQSKKLTTSHILLYLKRV